MSSALRRIAQTVRHCPGLNRLDRVWSILRQPYRRLLDWTGKAAGIEVTIAGHRVRLDPTFAHVGWESVEPEAYRAFSQAVRPGCVVFDIGAHIGTYTILALQRSTPDGLVVAYEPHFATNVYLRRHLQWNGAAERVVLRSCCCGAKSETGEFYCVPDQPEGRNSLLWTEGFAKSRVEVATIDNEVAQLGLVPSVIKIDVEGAEWDVLRGAERTLTSCRPILFVSLHPPQLLLRRERPSEVLDWLRARGYCHELLGEDHEVHVRAVPIRKVPDIA